MNQSSESAVAQTEAEQEKLRLFDLHLLASFRNEGPSVHIVSDEPGTRLVLLSLKAGQHLKEHQTKSVLFVQAIQGRATFSASGKSVELEAGKIVRVDAALPHQVTALTDAVLLLTMTPSPATIQKDGCASSQPYSHL